MNKLQLVTTKHFNGCALDCYVEPEHETSGDFWATRTQIGQLLEYSEPGIAIGNIHNRNKDRLDRFSRVNQIDLPSGGVQEVVLYNFKGLLEICRYSQQPKANAVMDWLWEVADEIRRTGSYSTKKRLPPRSLKDAEPIISKAVRCKTEADCQEVYALDRAFQSVYGRSILEVAEIQPQASNREHKLPRKSREDELWEHIVSTFEPDEWFTSSALYQTLDDALSLRQVQRYLTDLVARHLLSRRGQLKSSRYNRRR